MIKIGCFALVTPFSPLNRQFQAIRERGFDYVDLTDSHDGALLGIELLIEPHGIVTDNVEATAELLERIGHPDTVGLNLDTGNLWLGGGDNLEYIERFADRIKHVHWKDLGSEWEPKHGEQFGCGMGLIPLGDGVIGIPEIAAELKQRGFDGPTTLEIFGDEAAKTSAERLRQWFA